MYLSILTTFPTTFPKVEQGNRTYGSVPPLYGGGAPLKKRLCYVFGVIARAGRLPALKVAFIFWVFGFQRGFLLYFFTFIRILYRIRFDIVLILLVLFPTSHHFFKGFVDTLFREYGLRLTVVRGVLERNESRYDNLDGFWFDDILDMGKAHRCHYFCFRAQFRKLIPKLLTSFLAYVTLVRRPVHGFTGYIRVLKSRFNFFENV